MAKRLLRDVGGDVDVALDDHLGSKVSGTSKNNARAGGDKMRRRDSGQNGCGER